MKSSWEYMTVKPELVFEWGAGKASLRKVHLSSFLKVIGVK